MKKLLPLLLLLLSVASVAQVEPNTGLNRPIKHTPDWDIQINQNWDILDALFSGGQAVPGFVMQGAITDATLPFASLPSSANGTHFNCSDCTFPSTPCVGGGTGSIAYRQGGVWSCGTTSGGGTGNMLTNAANTMTSSGTIDMSSASATAGFTLPRANGAVPTGAGVLSFDTTASQPVVGDGTNTRKVPYVTGTTPSNGDCTKFAVSGTQIGLADAGTACTSASTLGIYAAAYGVVGEGHASNNGVWLISSSIITCVDCHFNTNATIGQIVFGSNLTAGGGTASSTIIMPQGTISSIDSDTQIHTTATSSSACAGGCLVVWGTDESTQLTNAWNAAYGSCTNLILPGFNPEQSGPAIIMVQSMQFVGNPSNTCPNMTGGDSAGDLRDGPGVVGQGINASYIMVTPSFNYGGCTVACFFHGVVDGLELHDFTFHGGGNSLPGSAANSLVGVDINFANNAYAHDMAFLFWGAAQYSLPNAFTCVRINWATGQGTFARFHEDGCGAIGVKITGGPVTNAALTLSQFDYYDNGLSSLYINMSGEIFSYGGNYGGATNTNVDVTGGARFRSIGEYYPITSARNLLVGYNQLTAAGGGVGTVYLTDDYIHGSGGSGNIYIDNSTDTVYMTGTVLLNSNAGIKLITNNGKFFDLGGNTYTNTSNAIYAGTGTQYSRQSNTGVTITAGAAVLSGGWGSTAAWSAMTGDNSFAGTITASGTGQGANPTITYTFPTVPLTAPSVCKATQVGGTQAWSNFITGTPTQTGVTFTYNGTPVAANTILVQVDCQ